MQKIDICSVFGNLLDNAIRASLQYKTNKDEPEIYLTAGAKGDYLIIKCKNSSMKPGDKPDGTGYGLKILKEIALKYDKEAFISVNDVNEVKGRGFKEKYL